MSVERAVRPSALALGDRRIAGRGWQDYTDHMDILIALDRSEYSEIVLEHGLDQAADLPGATLHLLTVVDDEADVESARRWLAGVVDEGLETFDLGQRSVELHVLAGRPASAIVALAKALAADLLVIGRFDVPSVSDRVVDSLDCPTLVVGIEGCVLAPQCPDCMAIRRDSGGEQLFCEMHSSDRLADLTTRLPSSSGTMPSRLW
jgi:nucleotide-binding universal stress UspA family protein